MGWIDQLFEQFAGRHQGVLQAAQRQFSLFRDLLDLHNAALKLISRLEEAHQVTRCHDPVSFWRDSLKIKGSVSKTVECMIELGGNEYIPLRERLDSIAKQIEESLPFDTKPDADEYTIPFRSLRRRAAYTVGTKNANLGELKAGLGLPVPKGFAISASGYRRFLDANQLSERVNGFLSGIHVGDYADLEAASRDIRDEIVGKPVPDDLSGAIYDAFDALTARTGKSVFALRSSAIGEDTSSSFAGQYLSLLNVRRDTLLDHYKRILASTFTPSALYYTISHSHSEFDLGMGVVCMEIVDAAVSGVVYTLDPLNPDGSYIVVNSIFGLGSNLVDGTVTPDVFYVSRKDRDVIFSRLSRKPLRLALDADRGIEQVPIPEGDQDRPSLDKQQLDLLVGYALRIEEAFGCPQDIEWAVDRKGDLFLLQARSLNIAESPPVSAVPAESHALVLLEGGTPLCGGVGTGRVFHLTSVSDLNLVPEGAVVVTPNPSPYLVAVMDRISALVTLVGGNISHLATLARELRVPTVVGMTRAHELPPQREVTVDASRGIIYDGLHPEWVPVASGDRGGVTNPETDDIAQRMIDLIVHLNVIQPNDPQFTAENCRTFHDILRFIHQKAMEEIFAALKETRDKEKIGLRLKTKIPLVINIIYLDQDFEAARSKRWVPDLQIQSRPMQALWSGILQEGWPETHAPADPKGFLAVIGANLQGGHKPEFSENSYAFLSQDYMLLNLRMGYHFSTIESMVSPVPEKNFIRMQFKLGGAPLERRIRRIWLITQLLSLMGFENSSDSDFLSSTIAYQSEADTLRRLEWLGRLTILTKQLDMALSSDARARWYLKEFTSKLGLGTQGASPNGNEMRG